MLSRPAPPLPTATTSRSRPTPAKVRKVEKVEKVERDCEGEGDLMPNCYRTGELTQQCS